MSHALRRAVAGVAAGATLAFFLAREMRSLLFGIEASDPLSFAIVSTAVIGVAVAATLLPVRQALRPSPVKALRDS